MYEEIAWLCLWRQNAFAWSANPTGGSNLVAVSCSICIGFDSPSNHTILCTPTVTSPLPYLPAATADIILDPISNETPPLTSCFVFNKSVQQHPHIPVALRMGIYHSAVDQIWHTPSCVGNSWGGYTHIVDLLAWYTGQSKIKYVPRDISHLSWNCHKPIFTARTSRNWKRGNTVASWPSKQSSALKVSLHSSIRTSWTGNAQISPFQWTLSPSLLLTKAVLVEKVTMANPIAGKNVGKVHCCEPAGELKLFLSLYSIFYFVVLALRVPRSR